MTTCGPIFKAVLLSQKIKLQHINHVVSVSRYDKHYSRVIKHPERGQQLTYPLNLQIHVINHDDEDGLLGKPIRFFETLSDCNHAINERLPIFSQALPVLNLLSAVQNLLNKTFLAGYTGPSDRRDLEQFMPHIHQGRTFVVAILELT